jgi:predicted nuclease of restriction endonuclease-like (RecB) superfamily
MKAMPANYVQIVAGLKEKIRLARQKVSFTVNKELLKVYWEIGTIILEQQKEGWGIKVIDRLAADLKMEFPDFKGISVRNLKYMRAFAEAWPDFQIVQAPLAQLQTIDKQESIIVQQAVAQLPWAHHISILEKLKSREERLFYIQKAIENGWSRNVLLHQIETKLIERTGKAITNFNNTLPAIQSDLAQQTIKNPYVFDFLSFSEEIKERELEKALIQHLKNFMLELGKGFAYVGNQKNLVVDGDDFFLDLLFYNYHLHCFVVFELKIGEFVPEFAGKLNFYVNTINEQLKGDEDKPTIGVLLCKTPNETVIKYSLKGIGSPIGVADYQLAKALPAELKTEMPTVEELEAEIDKGFEELKTPAEKRLDVLKEKLAALKIEEVQTGATYSILCDLFDQSLFLLFKRLLEKINDFRSLFLSHDYFWQLGDKVITDLNELGKFWKDESYLRKHHLLPFYYRLNGFKKGGTDTFDFLIQFNHILDVYSYGFSLINYNNGQPFLKKYYHQQLSQNDIEVICNVVYDVVLVEIETRFEYLTK